VTGNGWPAARGGGRFDGGERAEEISGEEKFEQDRMRFEGRRRWWWRRR
jgi:hypothetical protein